MARRRRARAAPDRLAVDPGDGEDRAGVQVGRVHPPARGAGQGVAGLDEAVVDDRQGLVDVLDRGPTRRRRSRWSRAPPRRRRGTDVVTRGAARGRRLVLEVAGLVVGVLAVAVDVDLGRDARRRRSPCGAGRPRCPGPGRAPSRSCTWSTGRPPSAAMRKRPVSAPAWAAVAKSPSLTISGRRLQPSPRIGRAAAAPERDGRALEPQRRCPDAPARRSRPPGSSSSASSSRS